MRIGESIKKDNKMIIIKRLFFILLGNLLCALAFNAFFIPSKLLSGGVGGIALMVQYLWDVPSGITVFLINIPIFLVGARMVDREYAVYGFISMLVFSTLLTVTNGIDKYFGVEDIILGAVFGGIFNGVGMGLMFRNRTCQGGLDIIATILKKRHNINIGTGLMMVNTVIVSLSSFLFSARAAMYTLIAMYIGYQVLDKVQMGFNVKKNVVIVSNKSEEVANKILNDLHRGVTFLEGMGAYTKENKKVIYCIITSNEVVRLKTIVDEIDPSAFLTINDVVEVKGSSFINEGI